MGKFYPTSKWVCTTPTYNFYSYICPLTLIQFTMTHTALLFALFFCHFLADYTHLSTKWMLDAKRLGTPLVPILCHAMIHGLVMWTPLYLISGADIRDVNFMILFQVMTHFLIDVLKGKMNVWLPALQSPANKGHWIIFGLDQFLHACVIIVMVSFV